MTNHQTMMDNMRNLAAQLMRDGPQATTAAIQQALQNAGAASGQTVRPTADAGSGQPAARGNVLHDINPPPARTADAPARSFAAPGHSAASRPFAPAADHGADANSAHSSGIASIKQRMAAAMDGMPDFVPDLLSKLGSAGGATGRQKTAAPAAPLPPGAQFVSASFTNAAGTRQYKLYIPASYDAKPLPLVVMLHGCTQDPDDFAAGTQMNVAAELQHCLVLYPQQPQSANSSRCWNWFNAGDQQRDAGEPAILAGMTRDIAQRYAVDPRQIFIAGMSAGGAMAAIMGTTYPELYAGVAIHSGLPYGAATDLPSALAAMRSGVAHPPSAPRGGQAFKGIPVIVFHGDADHTVNMRNGEQAMSSIAPAPETPQSSTRERGQAANGKGYTRTVQKDAGGKPVAEHWLVHGLGHAWAGGSAAGSYTDASGPDATGEMMRFFYTQTRPGDPA